MKPDLEKVIRGLEFVMSHDATFDKSCEAAQAAIDLLKAQDKRIKELESQRVTMVNTGSGAAIGAVHGDIVINRTYNQTAKEITNIKNVGELHV